MINEVTLIGHLGADPEVRRLENGTAVGRFSLATNESYKDKDGNWQTTTEWHNVVVWRDQAERAETVLKKGALCFVSGKISYRKYTDKDGVERQVTDIVADRFRLLEKKEGGSEGARFPQSEPGTTPSNSASSNTTSNAKEVGVPPEAGVPEASDDLPF